MKKLLFISAMVLLFCSKILAQDKVYMPYFEVINMHKDYQKAATRLLKMYINQGSKYELIADSLCASTKEAAWTKAKSVSSKHFIIGELNRIGEVVIVSMTMYNTESGSKEWNTMQKALSPEDLDAVMQKIVFSLNGNESKDIYTVTNYESKELNKVTATTYWGLSIGGGATFFKNVDNPYPAGFSGIFSGDNRTLIFDLKGNLYFGDVNLYSLSLHVNYPFSSGERTPYVGAGLGYGGTTVTTNTTNYSYNSYSYYGESSTGSGLTMFLGGGYIFNRTSNINLRIDANAFFSAYKVAGTYPVGMLLGLSILF